MGRDGLQQRVSSEGLQHGPRQIACQGPRQMRQTSCTIRLQRPMYFFFFQERVFLQENSRAILPFHCRHGPTAAAHRRVPATGRRRTDTSRGMDLEGACSASVRALDLWKVYQPTRSPNYGMVLFVFINFFQLLSHQKKFYHLGVLNKVCLYFF